MGADAAIRAQIGLVRGDEEVALGKRREPLGTDAGGEKLEEHRRRRVAHVVDADDGPALRADEGHRRLAEGGDRDRLGLGALVARPPLRIVPDLRDRILEGRAALVNHRAFLVPHGEAAAAAVHVALVGGDEMGVVEPGDGVGLAQHVLLSGVKGEGALLLRVDPLERHRVGGEVVGDGSVADDDDVVVFLERHHDLAGIVDVDVFRLGILGGDLGEAGDLDPLEAGAIERAIGHRHGHDEARRHLWDTAVAQILVALVLDRDGEEAAVRGRGHGVGLAAEVAASGFLLCGDVDRGEVARRIGEARGGVHPDEGGRADDRHRGRLTLGREGAERLRRRGVGDADEADHAERAVAVDEGLAVFRCGQDLGRGFAAAVLAVGHVVRYGEARDAVEGHLLRQRATGGERDRGDDTKQSGHSDTPLVFFDHSKGKCRAPVTLP